MSEISSGLVAVAWMTDREVQHFGAKDLEPYNLEQCPLVRLSDAVAIIAAKDAEIAESDHIRDRCAHLLAETAVALKGPEKALHRHGWQDLPEVAAKQSAALKLARQVLMSVKETSSSTRLRRIVDEPLAAIHEVLKGE